MTLLHEYHIILMREKCEMLNNLFNNSDNDNIIAKSQMYEKMQPDKILGDSFAKTINYQGIHSNFCLDIPEIIEEEKKQQQKRDDIAKFTRLAFSDLDDNSHIKMVEDLFSNPEIMKEYEAEVLSSLSVNDQLLNDLGL